MIEGRGVRIIRADCFELCGEIFLGISPERCVLLAVLSGWVSIGDDRSILSENSIFIKSGESELRVSEGNSGVQILLVEFEGSEFSDKDIFDRIIPVGRMKRRYLGEIIREMSQKDNDTAALHFLPEREQVFGQDETIRNALSSLVIKVVRDSFSNGEDSSEDYEVKNTAQALRRYLYENYKTRITLDSLCFLFRTNKTSICKQFRDEYGMTVVGYLNHLRIKEGKRLLLENRLSVTEIADQLGFESIHYFSRLFKKTVGQTPRDYLRIVGKRQKFIESE